MLSFIKFGKECCIVAVFRMRNDPGFYTEFF